MGVNQLETDNKIGRKKSPAFYDFTYKLAYFESE
jgi:hypothetical protein